MLQNCANGWACWQNVVQLNKAAGSDGGGMHNVAVACVCYCNKYQHATGKDNCVSVLLPGCNAMEDVCIVKASHATLVALNWLNNPCG